MFNWYCNQYWHYYCREGHTFYVSICSCWKSCAFSMAVESGTLTWFWHNCRLFRNSGCLLFMARSTRLHLCIHTRLLASQFLPPLVQLSGKRTAWNFTGNQFERACRCSDSAHCCVNIVLYYSIRPRKNNPCSIVKRKRWFCSWYFLCPLLLHSYIRNML